MQKIKTYLNWWVFLELFLLLLHCCLVDRDPQYTQLMEFDSFYTNSTEEMQVINYYNKCASLQTCTYHLLQKPQQLILLNMFIIWIPAFLNGMLLAIGWINLSNIWSEIGSASSCYKNYGIPFLDGASTVKDFGKWIKEFTITELNVICFVGRDNFGIKVDDPIDHLFKILCVNWLRLKRDFIANNKREQTLNEKTKNTP